MTDGEPGPIGLRTWWLKAIDALGVLNGSALAILALLAMALTVELTHETVIWLSLQITLLGAVQEVIRRPKNSA